MSDTKCVFLDLETTGFSPTDDDILEVAICDQEGRALVNTLVKPEKKSSWPYAQRVHGITPYMVASAPTLREVIPLVAQAITGKTLVIYNKAFDLSFLLEHMSDPGVKEVRCCMVAFSEYIEEDLTHHPKPWKLAAAAAYANFKWPSEAHRALADTQATAWVWKFIHDPLSPRTV